MMMSLDTFEFQANLVKIARGRGVTFEDIGHDIGYSRTSVSNWLTGNSIMNLEVAHRMAKLLKLKIVLEDDNDRAS